MANHMFRVFVALDISKSDLQQRVDDWVVQHTKWDDARAGSASVIEARAEPTDPDTAYYQVDIHFDRTDTKDNILQKLGNKLKNKCDWYRALYHECDHDESGDSGCPWDIWEQDDWTAKGQTIPEYVRDINQSRGRVSG